MPRNNAYLIENNSDGKLCYAINICIWRIFYRQQFHVFILKKVYKNEETSML